LIVKGLGNMAVGDMISKEFGTLSYLDVAKIIKRITYKEGFRIAFGVDSGNRMYVCTFRNRDVLDSYISIKFEFSDARNYFTDKDVIETIKEDLTYIENHERDEWFKFDGHRIFDPHPPTFISAQVTI